MDLPLITSDDPVIFIGGGEFDPEMLSEALTWTRRIVAADGGAARALAAGLVPDAVVGDLDSLDPETRAAIPSGRLFRIAEQESTDFAKCLTRVEAPLVLALGFTGARIDHALAAMTALCVHAGRRCLVIGPQDVVFHAPPRLELPLAPGTRLSLFPLRAVTGRSSGLRWPIEGLTLAPWGRIGTSNEATGPVSLQFDGPGMLVILPRDQLALAAAALAPGCGALAGE